MGLRICDRVPLVPSTWIANVPIEAVGDAVTVRRLVPVSLGIGVIGDAICVFASRGGVPIQDADKVTAEVNPSREMIATVADPLCPCMTARPELDSSVKSGVRTDVVLIVVVRLVGATVTENVTEATSSLGLPIAVTT